MLTPEQIKNRKNKITSSIAAACLGLCDYTTPLQAALKARGETEYLPPVNEDACERGDELEHTVLQWGAKKLGLTLVDAPYMEIDGWAGDSADGLYVDGDGVEKALAEAKTAAAGVAAKYGDAGTDEVPEACLVQSQWHLLFRPHIEVCYVPVLKGGYRMAFDLHPVHADKELHELLLEELHEFWRKYVDPSNPSRTLPPADAGDDAYLKRRWPRHRDEDLIESDEIWEALVRESHKAKEALKAAETTEEAASNRLRAALADAAGVKGSWGKATYRKGKDKQKVDWKALATEIAGGEVSDELLSKHTVETPGSRSLLVRPRKGVWT